MTVLQRQIVCTAESWMGTVEVPFGSNHGGRVDEILKMYFGDTVARPWCVAFAWDVVDVAVRALGGTNYLPGNKTALGNARKTLDLSRAIFRVDQIPVVGAVFFRTSTSALQGKGGDGSSGHFGVVVDVVPNWQSAAGSAVVLTTIEGNQGDTNKVDRYSYTADQIPAYGFWFIHTEDTPVTATSVVPPCQPEAPPPPPPPPMEKSNVDQPTAPPPPPSTPPPLTPGTPVYSQKRKECEVVVINRRLSGTGTFQSHDKLLNNLPMAADIFGATFDGGSAAFYQKRNGAAVNRLTGSPDRDGHSGLGVFVLPKSKRLVYIGQEGTSLQYQALWNNNLFGRSYGAKRPPIQINIGRYFGDGYTEQLSEFVAGLRSFGDLNDRRGSPLLGSFTNEVGKEYPIYSDTTWISIFGKQIRLWGFPLMLDDIDNQFPPGPEPIVIRFWGDAQTFQTVLLEVVKVIDVGLKLAGPFLPQSALDFIGSDYVQAIRQSIVQLATQPNMTLGDYLNQATNLVALVAPDSTALQYVRSAKDIYGAAASSPPNWSALAAQLGIAYNQLPQGMRDAGDLVNSWALSDIGSKINDTVQNITARFADVTNFRMFDDARKLFYDSNTFASQLLSYGNNALSMPVFQSMFLNGAAGRSLVSIPNISGAMGVVLDRSEEIRNQGRVDVVGNLGLAAIGFDRPEESFGDLAYQALRWQFQQAVQKARDVGNQALSTFTIPGSIAPDDRECYAFLLRDDERGEIERNNTTIIIGDRPPSTPPTYYNDFTTPGGGVPVVTPKVPGVPPSDFTPGGSTPGIEVGKPSTPPLCPPRYVWSEIDGMCKLVELTATPADQYERKWDENTIQPGQPGLKVNECPPGWEWDQFAGRCVQIPPFVKPLEPVVPPPPPPPPPSDFDPPTYTPPVVRPPTYTPPVVQPPTYTPPVVQPPTYTPPVVQPPTYTPPPPPKMDCPPGYVFENGFCVPPVANECPPGYTYDGEKCVPPVVTLKKQECPPGYTFDGEKCIPPVENKCPPGYTFDGEQCVPPVRTRIPDEPPPTDFGPCWPTMRWPLVPWMPQVPNSCDGGCDPC